MYLIDGIEVEKKDFILPVENIGVWRGDGIFEAIRIHEGYPFGIDLHIERFKKSASKVSVSYTHLTLPTIYSV